MSIYPKIKSLRLIFLLSFFVFLSSKSISQCNNGNAEDANFTGWNGATSIRTNQGINIGAMTNGIDPNFHSITNVGFDPNVGGNLLPMVGEGIHSFKLGDNLANTHGDRLSYTFTVTAANANFGFKFAMVLQDGDHPQNENPFFSYVIQKGNNPNVNPATGPNAVIAGTKFIADKTNPFFKLSGAIVWRDWSYECVNLTAFIGQVVTISFYAADCSNGGHWGYAYIDGLCSNPSPTASFTIPASICYSDPVIMNASASTNEDSYFLSVQECDQWWNATGPETMEWFVAQQAGLIDLKAFLTSHGKSFECNKYYRVKLAVSNKCVNWVDLTKKIYIYCPQMNDIPDVTRCCSQIGQPVVLGPVSNTPGYTTTWTSGGGVSFNPNPTNQYTAHCNAAANGYVDVTVSQITYNQKPKPPSVCSVSQHINFVIFDDFTVEIVSTPIDCCKEKLTAKIVFLDNCNNWSNLKPDQQQVILDHLEFSWSNGEVGSSIIASGPTATYTVTVKAMPCYTHTATYNYVQSPIYASSTSYPVVLSAPNALIAGSSGDDGKLIIIGSYYDSQGLYFPPMGSTPGIYKSQAMKLEIYNRWGELFRTIEFEDCGQLAQGDVFWDGTYSNGEYVQDGVYVYKLYTKNCGSQTWLPYCNQNFFTYMNNGGCLKYCWGHIPGGKWWQFGYYCCQKWNNGDCAYRITVLN